MYSTRVYPYITLTINFHILQRVITIPVTFARQHLREQEFVPVFHRWQHLVDDVRQLEGVARQVVYLGEVLEVTEHLIYLFI